MLSRLLLLMLVTGCDLVFTLSPPDATPFRDTGGGDGPGAYRFPHLPSSVTIGDDDVTIDVKTTIQTEAMTIDPPRPGTDILVVGQLDGPELMVIRVRDLAIAAEVVVEGTRPLVIVGRRITLSGILDASAKLDFGGPGSQTTGPAVGGDGVRTDMNASGAGGGGFGPGGRIGGFAGIGMICASPMVFPGDEGKPTDDPELAILQGGGAGGGGLNCSTFGGGGGGAVQLSALERITVLGTIDVGGGGGSGGGACMLAGATADGGGGGGAGGAIYLDAPDIQIQEGGVLAANGGGGGGGGCDDSQQSGMPGNDAERAAAFAKGGAALPGCGEQGGAGAFGSSIATAGGSIECDGQAGGGGGAVGRIVLRGVVSQDGTVTPPPTTLPR